MSQGGEGQGWGGVSRLKGGGVGMSTIAHCCRIGELTYESRCYLLKISNKNANDGENITCRRRI